MLLFPLFTKSVTLSEEITLVLYYVFLTNKCWMFLAIFLAPSVYKLILYRVMVGVSAKLQINKNKADQTFYFPK